MFPVINVGPLSLPAPAMLLILGYLAGSYLVGKKASSFSINSDFLDRVLWIGSISTLLGARLSYIAGSPAAFKGDLLSIFSLNPSLLDPIGGTVIGLAVIFIIVSKEKTDVWTFLDSLTPFLGALLPAFFLSRFASGSGYGLSTNKPWGIYLWGSNRHPVQLYLAIAALALLIIFLIYAPFKNKPSGSTFLLFSATTTGYLLFLSAFQEPTLIFLGGFRTQQMVHWLLLLFTIILLNYRIKPTLTKVQHETE